MKIKIFCILLFICICVTFLFWSLEKKEDSQVTTKPSLKYQKTILAFGDSLTFGYQLNNSDSYPSQLQRLLEQKGYKYKVINAGINGDTTAGGLRRIDWYLEDKPDIVILTLGANDMLRGNDPNNIEQNLDKLLSKISDSGAQIVLGGMLSLNNLGEPYISSFNAIYPNLAEKYSVLLIPFFLDGVALKAELNLPDGIHPTKEGYKLIVQKNIWPKLQTLLDKDTET